MYLRGHFVGIVPFIRSHLHQRYGATLPVMAAVKHSVKQALANVEYYVSRSTFGRFFRLQNCGHENARQDARFWNEIRAGLTTFFTMAYIISVNVSTKATYFVLTHLRLVDLRYTVHNGLADRGKV